MSIELPHQPTSTCTSIESSSKSVFSGKGEKRNNKDLSSVPVKLLHCNPSQGGESAPTWETNDWEEHREYEREKTNEHQISV